MQPTAPGARVAYWRRRRKLTQQELAELLKTTRASISRKEAGKQAISAEEMEQIRRLLHVAPAQYYGRAGGRS